MALKTRKPTGAVPWPLILLEGGEKSGKSYAAAILSASPKVGRTAWLDLNEGAADEYGAIPGARYEVIEHDGSWQSIAAAIADAKAEAKKDRDNGEKPFVLVIDSMTAEWDLLKAWAESRAKKTDFNKAKLAKDPNAEISVSMNFWNDATSRHRRVMTMLMTFPGIVVMTARGKDVAALDGKGRPIEGTKEYRVEGNKNLAYDASCWVRMYRDKPAIVVGARSVHAGVRPGKDNPRSLHPDWTLEWLIFDVLKCNPDGAHVRDLAEMRPQRTPEEIRDEALQPETDFARIRDLYAEAEEAGYGDVTVFDEQEKEELLLHLLKRVGDGKRPERSANRNGQERQQQPSRKPQQSDQGSPRRQDGNQSRAPQKPAPDLGDWDVKIAEIATPDDVAAIREEVTRLYDQGSLEAERANEIQRAVDAKVAELRGQAQQRQRPRAVPDQPETQAQADAAAQSAANGGDAESDWVTDFTARAGEVESADGIRGFKLELARAVRDKTVTPETANKLGALLRNLENSLRSAA